MSSDAGLVREMLTTAKNIAVVGLSDKPWRASNNIARYLIEHGYKVIPVNPVLTEVLGLTCYPSIASAQAAEGPIDLVNVFRASEHVPAIVDEVIALKIPYLWLQDGVQHDEAVARAQKAGIRCVQNDCIFRRHAALLSVRQ